MANGKLPNLQEIQLSKTHTHLELKNHEQKHQPTKQTTEQFYYC